MSHRAANATNRQNVLGKTSSNSRHTGSQPMAKWHIIIPKDMTQPVQSWETSLQVNWRSKYSLWQILYIHPVYYVDISTQGFTVEDNVILCIFLIFCMRRKCEKWTLFRALKPIQLSFSIHKIKIFFLSESEEYEELNLFQLISIYSLIKVKCWNVSFEDWVNTSHLQLPNPRKRVLVLLSLKLPSAVKLQTAED